MESHAGPTLGMGPPGALARPDWRPGGSFAASELRLGHGYQLQRLRRHLRLVHGWGVVCGLNVVAANDPEGWGLLICPGYGIGPCGDEILLQHQYRFDLRDYLWTRPVGGHGQCAWIGIEAGEAPASYQSAPPAACCCCCADQRVVISRLVDECRVVVSWTRPIFTPGGFDICSGAVPFCPECPPSCALPLASVVLPISQ